MKFPFVVTSSVWFDTCIGSFGCHCKSGTHHTPENSLVRPTPAAGNPLSAHRSCSFAFSRMFYEWNRPHAIHETDYFTSRKALEVHYVVAWTTVRVFLLLGTVPWQVGAHSFHLFTPPRTSGCF